MAGQVRVSEDALNIGGLFYKIYRVIPSSVHGRWLRVYVEDLPVKKLRKNLMEFAYITSYKIIVNKRRLTAEEAERYFGTLIHAERKEERGIAACNVSRT
ncbi:MAG: hypothetical protein PHH00_04445 [Candidatus Nanoarchaeia archaeon]|nr:hypothetical protein [Candidatus Nanoarchaeia archaeon]